MVVAGSLSVGRLIPEFLIPYDAPYVFHAGRSSLIHG